jgi:hypothetical protein
LIDCEFVPLWTTRQASVTVGGTQGDVTLRVERPYILSGASYTLRTFVKDSGSGTAASVTVRDVVYSDTSTNTPLYFENAAGRYAINTTTTGTTTKHPQGLASSGPLTVSALSTPAAPTITVVGTAGSTSYWYKWVAAVGLGTGGNVFETAPSTATQITTGNATLNGTNYNTITGTPVDGASSYILLKSTDGVTYAKLASGLVTPTYNDQGASTTAFTVTGVANPSPIATVGGMRITGIGRVNGSRAGMGQPALYSDDGSRLFFLANQSTISIQPNGDGSGTGQVTISPTLTQTNVGLQRGVKQLTYSASITPSAQDGDWQYVLATNGTAFTINNASNPPDSSHTQDLTVEIVNTSGGALGAISWGAIYVFVGGAFTAPASGFARFIRFAWNRSKWVEIARSSADY